MAAEETASPKPAPKEEEEEEEVKGADDGGTKGSKRPDLTVPVCRDFTRRRCARLTPECRYAHPPSNVVVEGDDVTVCYDSLRDRCVRGFGCRYFHPPPHIRVKLQEAAGLTPSSAPAGYQIDHVRSFDRPYTNFSAAQKVTSKLVIEVCRDFIRGRCSRKAEECRYAHHTLTDGDGDFVIACQDFLHGRCQREVCRYFHVPEHLRARIKDMPRGSVGNGHGFDGGYGVGNLTSDHGYGGRSDYGYSGTSNYEYGGYKQVAKRMRMDDSFVDMSHYHGPSQGGSSNRPLPMPMQPVVPGDGDTRGWNKDDDKLPVCKDFYRKGDCLRGLSCRYVHPASHVDVVDNFVTVCRDSLKGRCSRDHCRFHHPSGKERS